MLPTPAASTARSRPGLPARSPESTVQFLVRACPICALCNSAAASSSEQSQPERKKALPIGRAFLLLNYRIVLLQRSRILSNDLNTHRAGRSLDALDRSEEHTSELQSLRH